MELQPHLILRVLHRKYFAVSQLASLPSATIVCLCKNITKTVNSVLDLQHNTITELHTLIEHTSV